MKLRKSKFHFVALPVVFLVGVWLSLQLFPIEGNIQRLFWPGVMAKSRNNEIFSTIFLLPDRLEEKLWLVLPDGKDLCVNDLTVEYLENLRVSYFRFSKPSSDTERFSYFRYPQGGFSVVIKRGRISHLEISVPKEAYYMTESYLDTRVPTFRLEHENRLAMPLSEGDLIALLGSAKCRDSYFSSFLDESGHPKDCDEVFHNESSQ